MSHFGKPLSIFSLSNYGFANLFQVFQVLNNIQLDGQRLLLAFLILQSKRAASTEEKKDSFTKQTPLSSHLIQRETNRTGHLY